VHVVAAAAGVSVFLAKSAAAFATVKYAGAAYLCFLGVRMILDARKDTDKGKNNNGTHVPMVHPRRGALRQGILTEVLNPKTALFFSLLFPNS